MPNSIARRALVSFSGKLLSVPLLSIAILVAAPVAAEEREIVSAGGTPIFGPPEQLTITFTDDDRLAVRLRRQGVSDAEAAAIEAGVRKTLSSQQRRAGALLQARFAGDYRRRSLESLAVEPVTGSALTLTRASLGLPQTAPSPAEKQEAAVATAAPAAAATPELAAPPVAAAAARPAVQTILTKGAAPAVSAAPPAAERYAPTPGYAKAVGVGETDVAAAMQRAGVPRPVAQEITDAIKLHPTLAKADLNGSRFEVVYDPSYDAKAGFSLAAFNLEGRDHRLWRFLPSDAPAGYFTDDGRRVGGIVLRSPMPGVEINSPYGMRKHPVLRVAKMHWGVDFPADAGTPILAAADGVITAAKRYGNYGLYMHIDHGQGVATTYGHMQRFAPGMRPGTQVRAGDVVAFVGRSGLATGPHLYFEVVIGTRRVDPKPLLAEGAHRLLGSDLVAFERIKQQTGATEIATDTRN